MGVGSAMNNQIKLYALKCQNGYIKIENGVFRTVEMSKASVFKDISDLKTAEESVADTEGVWAVVLTISEQQINIEKDI